MRMDKKGFTLIELLAVIVILAIIALVAAPIMLRIIADSRESANSRSIEKYGQAIGYSLSQVTTKYPDVIDYIICMGDVPTVDCHVDATVKAKEDGESSANMPGMNPIVKAIAVKYTGTAVKCTDYEIAKGTLVLLGCLVGDGNTKYTYSSVTGVARIEG